MKAYYCDRCETEIEFVDGNSYRPGRHGVAIGTEVGDLCQNCLDDLRDAYRDWLLAPHAVLIVADEDPEIAAELHSGEAPGEADNRPPPPPNPRPFAPNAGS